MMMKLKELQKVQQQRNKAHDPIPASILHPNSNTLNKSEAKKPPCSPSQVSLISDLNNDLCNVQNNAENINGKNKQKKVYLNVR